jgi:hypothetical protein
MDCKKATKNWIEFTITAESRAECFRLACVVLCYRLSPSLICVAVSAERNRLIGNSVKSQTPANGLSIISSARSGKQCALGPRNRQERWSSISRLFSTQTALEQFQLAADLHCSPLFVLGTCCWCRVPSMQL